MTDLHLTQRELDVMTVLWDLGSGTVAEVRAHLHDNLAYTTVLTILRILEDKGHVTHEEQGRAHRYFPAIERAEAGTSALRRLLETVFGGSPELLLTNLVSDQNLSKAEISNLRRMLEAKDPSGKRK